LLDFIHDFPAPIGDPVLSQIQFLEVRARAERIKKTQTFLPFSLFVFYSIPWAISRSEDPLHHVLEIHRRGGEN
jgi:hypothetical protein